jgi:hypothetical protein
MLKKMYSKSRVIYLSLVALVGFYTLTAWAAEDEIQVYTDDMNEVGQFGVETHINYVPKGSRELSHPGETPSNHRLQVTPEFSYGISKSLEAGLYVPFAMSEDGNLYATGLRPRLKYIHQPEQPSIFFWGLNTEFGYSTLKVTNTMWGMELRPIMGIRTDQWLVSFNPIINVPLSKGGARSAEFEPALKVSRKVNGDLELGFEHYSGYGPLRDLQGYKNQVHTVYATADFKVRDMEVNFGVGRGYHNGEDDWIVKSIIAFPFN